MNKIEAISDKFIRKIFLQRRNLHLGIVLAFVAGTINSGGFLCVGQYTSHMTGIVSSVADFLIMKKFNLAFLGIIFLFSFFFGASVTAILVNMSKYRNHYNKLTLALILEVILLLIIGLISLDSFLIDNLKLLVICLLCFVMGLQNAMVTKISNARMRTTHVTGISTDIGIQIGKAIYKLFGNKEIKINHSSLLTHISLLSSFLLGGFLGALIFVYFGFFYVSVLASILIIFTLSSDIYFSKKNI